MRSAALMKRVFTPAMVARYARAIATALAHAGGSEQDDVLGTVDECQVGQFLDLRAGCAAGEGEVVLLQRLDCWQRCHLQ
jgi:hypothetical protein